ncbi:uncharacterized protein DUF3560 [Nonomuraea fuscirosea]|uniref:Uncharacterized protein DUF3560 n=1 Tax=Nonomuraea fuscirosea TaxID=1291556 RepID=A0A2T0N2K8_9ACTN|nr:DUF3560 domain-containing protein [Nonomuraea fuscirosea]PRX66185.1 uncharacterized protein DUF3560 [Nonomuraea fuscirosea]
MTITIKHNHEDGTLVYGTRKGDGVYEIIRLWENGGFKFFPSIRMLGLRNSRDQVADRYAISAAAKALRAAGYEVEVEIDDTFRDRAQVLADKADRLEDRRDALERKADRHAGAAAAAHDRAEQLSERFAGGQPILVGHHSERGARADQKRMHQAMSKSVRENDAAQSAAERANAVGSQMRRSATPAVTRRRIETAEAELRQIQKGLDGYERRHLDYGGNPRYIEDHAPAQGDYRERLLARKAQLDNQLEYDRAQLAAAIEAGEYVMWHKGNVHVGDMVTYWMRGRRRTVVKVNKVTVAVESGYSWPDKVKFTDILAVDCPHGEDGPAITTTNRPKKKGQARPKVEVPKMNMDELAAKIEAALPEVPRDSEAFFSPPAVVARILDAAGLEPGMVVLEPSAGAGAIAKAAAAAGCEVHCIKRYPQLSKDLLDVPGIVGLTTGDFLQAAPSHFPDRFDRVLMNPPFSRGQDIAHVVHALQFVKPGGRLVAVMGAGITFSQVKAAQDFRQLVEDWEGEIIPLPKDAFAAAGLSVLTVAVVIPC